MQYTPNLNLAQFEPNDNLYVESFNAFNDSFETLDTEVHNNSVDIDSVSADVDTLETKVDTEVAKINAKDKVQDLDIKLLKASAEGKLYTTDEDDDVAYIKDVNSNALPVAMMTKLGGRTIVGNQLNRNDAPTSTVSGVTFTNNGDGSWTINGTATSTILYVMCAIYPLPNHKYAIVTDNVNNNLGFGGGNTSKLPVHWGGSAIINAGASADGTATNLNINVKSGTYNNETIRVALVDVTLGFGQGNEPTIDEFVAIAPNILNAPYNAGTLESADTSKITSVGFNRWDEQWELGTYSGTTGEKQPSTTAIRNKNLIPIEPSTTYFFKMATTSTNTLLFFYDKNKNFLADISNVQVWTTTTLTTDSRAYYVAFRQVATSYSNNICINVSNSSLNGQYKPYFTKDHPIPQPIQDLGLNKSAGDVYDEVNYGSREGTLRTKILADLSTLGWSYNSANARWEVFNYAIADMKYADASLKLNAISTKYAIQSHNGRTLNEGVITCTGTGSLYCYTSDNVNKPSGALVYELATPIVTDLSDILTDDFLIEVEGGGTIEFVGNEDYNIPIPSTEVFYLKTV